LVGGCGGVCLGHDVLWFVIDGEGGRIGGGGRWLVVGLGAQVLVTMALMEVRFRMWWIVCFVALLNVCRVACVITMSVVVWVAGRARKREDILEEGSSMTSAIRFIVFLCSLLACRKNNVKANKEYYTVRLEQESISSWSLFRLMFTFDSVPCQVSHHL